FRGQGIDLAEVGAKLKVRTVLEGSVRRAGDRLRISAQLVKVADGYHLWSERYDREMPDVFAIQDEIAKAIANRLRVTLGDDGAPLVTPATGNLDAYHLYLKGRYYLAQRGLGLKKALECFDRAGARSAVRAGLRGPRGCLHGARAVRARAAQCAPTQGTRGRSESPRFGARPRGG